MSEFWSIFVALFAGIALGAVLGVASVSDYVAADCAAMGQTRVGKTVLICEPTP